MVSCHDQTPSDRYNIHNWLSWNGSIIIKLLFLICMNQGAWFNSQMSSYQCRKSHCGDKTVVRSSYLHNKISYTGTMTSGSRFNMKMSSNQYRKSHCGDKTVVRSSYLHNGISYTGKTTSLYWIRALNVESGPSISSQYRYRNSQVIKIGQSRDSLILILGVPTLVKLTLYILALP